MRDSFVYDPTTNRWSRLRPMPAGTERGSAAIGVRGSRIYLAGTAHGGIASAVVGSKIYTMGGEGNPAAGSQGIFPQNEAYDTKTNTWQPRSAVPARRAGAVRPCAACEAAWRIRRGRRPQHRLNGMDRAAALLGKLCA